MLLSFCPIRAGKASSTALADLTCLVMDADCARGSRHRLRVPAAPRLRRDESSWQARHGAGGSATPFGGSGGKYGVLSIPGNELPGNGTTASIPPEPLKGAAGQPRAYATGLPRPAQIPAGFPLRPAWPRGILHSSTHRYPGRTWFPRVDNTQR
jgi:hypothetical protein